MSLPVRSFIAAAAVLLVTQSGYAQDPAPPEEYADLRATITYKGDIPKNPTPDSAGFRRKLFRVDKSSLGLAGAVIFLVPFDAALIPTTHDPASEREPIVINQFDETFEPQVSAVKIDQPVQFTNEDAANHNVRATTEFPQNEFNIMTRPQREFEKSFVPEPDYQPIRLSCDIHAWMAAWLYVFDHPWFAVTDDRGRASIDNIPPGMYRMVIQQPAAQLTAHATVRIRSGKQYSITHYFNEEDLKAPEPAVINLIGFGPKQ